MKHRTTGTWVRISTDKFLQLRVGLAAQGVTMDTHIPDATYYAGWRLLYKGDPVAVWFAAQHGNMVEARVR